MTLYPGADVTSQWYEDDYPGSVMHPNVTTLHTTEGASFPPYAGGSEAPNLTIFANKTHRVFQIKQHFPLERSSRALVNKAGGVETNTLNNIQIELIGTCDPAHKDAWGAIYWPDAPEWCYVELGKVLANLHRLFPAMPLTAGGHVDATGRWPAYPESINANRMTFAQWDAFKGVCGHQHVPENVHGDPGGLPIIKILNYARGGTVTPTPAPKPVTRGPRVDAAIARSHQQIAELKLVKRPSQLAKTKAALAGEQAQLKLLLSYPPL